jgi:hypothetical protein
VKMTKVVPNNRKRAFEVYTREKNYVFPYAAVQPTPTRENKVVGVRVDEDMGREGFVYSLAEGDEGAVHIDHVLEYHRDAGYMADLLLYKLTLHAQEAVKKSALSTRELIRKLDTSPAQFYRLLDQTNYRKSMSQLLTLLHILGCDVDVVLKFPKARMQGGESASQEEIRVSSLASIVR